MSGLDSLNNCFNRLFSINSNPLHASTILVSFELSLSAHVVITETSLFSNLAKEKKFPFGLN
ncbi:MAG: hypothetical protein ACJ71F_15815 [Nitrososphaeraceae archaeon]